MLPHHKSTLDRFVAACQSDARIIAAALYGSNVKGTADAYSDLDLALITTDGAFDEFVAQRETFACLLGEPLFIETFGNPNFVFIMLADGTDMELMLGHAGQPNLDTSAPYHVLIDKRNIFAELPSESPPSSSVAQEKKLRNLLAWFWHDLAHFIAAMGRDQLWWAYGQLDILRAMCVNLARLTHDFSDPDVGEDPYFKIDKSVPAELLAPLQVTFCPMERGAMLRAGHRLLDFFRSNAIPLAQAHGMKYSAKLDRTMSERLEKLSA